MDLLRTGFKTVLGQPASPQGPSGAETVSQYGNISPTLNFSQHTVVRGAS